MQIKQCLEENQLEEANYWKKLEKDEQLKPSKLLKERSQNKSRTQ